MTAPLRVCIDVSAAVHQRAGLGRYAHELVKGLVDLRRGEVSSSKGAATAPLQLTAFYHQRGEAVLLPPIDQLPTLTTRLSVRPWRLTTALAYFTGFGQDRLFGSSRHLSRHRTPAPAPAPHPIRLHAARSDLPVRSRLAQAAQHRLPQNHDATLPARRQRHHRGVGVQQTRCGAAVQHSTR